MFGEMKSKHRAVLTTPKGIDYFVAPEVRIVGTTQFYPYAVGDYVDTFPESCNFGEYLKELEAAYDTMKTFEKSNESIVQFAGQLCYASFSNSKTSLHDLNKYMAKVWNSGHGSVFEHFSINFLVWGISRSLTHELVRHRHANISQASQRFQNGSTLRFVERPEFQQNTNLHNAFISRIERAYEEYEELANELAQNTPRLSNETATEYRKRLNQCARALLPNETETSLVWTLNLRSLFNMFHLRMAPSAEIEFQNLCKKMLQALREKEITFASLLDQ